MFLHHREPSSPAGFKHHVATCELRAAQVKSSRGKMKPQALTILNAVVASHIGEPAQ